MLPTSWWETFTTTLGRTIQSKVRLSKLLSGLSGERKRQTIPSKLSKRGMMISISTFSSSKTMTKKISRRRIEIEYHLLKVKVIGYHTSNLTMRLPGEFKMKFPNGWKGVTRCPMGPGSSSQTLI